jgi:hypothetical protein
VTGNVPTSARRPTEPLGSSIESERLETRALTRGVRSVWFAAGGAALGQRPIGLAAVVVSLLGACTSAPARSALQADLPALKSAIEQAEKQNRIDSSELMTIARAVLERELGSLSASEDSFPEVAPCARQIRPALERVAAGSSDYSAPAALALIDAGFAAPRGANAEATAQVIEARQAVGERAGERRRAFMLHGDASVRRGALSASLAGEDRRDVPALAEAARLDPDPEARALAIRALGRIGGDAAVLALTDVYASAPPPERREIVRSWSAPATFAAGGQAELEDLAQGSGEPSVLGAVALEARAPGSALASAALVRAIEGDAVEPRLVAIETAPWSDAAARTAILAARKHKDAATRVLALWRFAVAGELDSDATHELEKLGTDTVTPIGAVARAGLARAGQGSIKPALRADLAAKQADRRVLAALSLFELEDWAGTARALGDDSPRVRRAVACEVLADPKARRSRVAGSLPQPAGTAPGGASGVSTGVAPLLLSAAALVGERGSKEPR